MMDIKVTAATFIVLTLTSFMGAAFGQASTYFAQPDCSSLHPAPCRIIPSLDDNGKATYDDYEPNPSNHVGNIQRVRGKGFTTVTPRNAHSISGGLFCNFDGICRTLLCRESCPNHICYAIQPIFPAVYNTSSMSMSMSMIYNSSAPWFCSVANINYTARVEANTGYPPGTKEDMLARCQYQQLLDTQSLGDCRHMRFTCAECALYYRYWLCAMAFPQCDPSKTVTSNSTSSVPTKIFSIVKTCRGICWAVVQRCQQYANFNCPLSDTRDYGDYPQCNALGLDEGDEPIARSIYW